MSLQKILIQFEPVSKNLLSVLRRVQKENKYIGKDECEQIAKYFSLPLARVYSLVSFFDELKTRKNGKIVIKICSGSACYAKKTFRVVEQLENLLKVEVNSDSNPKYRLELMSCKGLCDRGPIMMINEQVFEGVLPETVDDIVKNYL